MNLDKFAIGVIAPLLVKRRLRRSRTNYRVGGPSKDRSDTAGRHDGCIRRKRTHFHRSQIHRANAPADPIGIEYGREKFPVLELFDLAFRLVVAHLLVERIEKLLSGAGPGDLGAIVEPASDAAEV